MRLHLVVVALGRHEEILCMLQAYLCFSKGLEGLPNSMVL